ncbi:MAG: class I SAM-dependent methyltransferase [Flavobacteriales bacterium]|jgi:2-polyprenyl-3-methyl-5-hydroxy-6-metoxy-1,4-benzoquinol methylase|nr:class I SAM-dependent methyltransferase [Flavobacteriales bacterium]MCB0757158.1 class I SAM-dependent methyltransferase [Flavobacteriales bacterium]
MEDHEESFALNRALWNARTTHHVGSKFYDVQAFLGGRNALSARELELLGNVAGKRVLHLQCHFGLDTLSLARMGAEMTGLDFSEVAIKEARKLAPRAGLKAEFIEANVLDLQPQLEGKFDIVFTSYGVLGWLPELGTWAQIIARYLKPGGKLVLVEFHPAVWMFNNAFSKVAYSYFNREVIEETEQSTYADTSATINLKSHGWNHSIAETITALLDAGMHIDRFEELDGSPHDCFGKTVKGEDGMYRIQGMEGKLPMVYTLVASRDR